MRYGIPKKKMKQLKEAGYEYSEGWFRRKIGSAHYCDGASLFMEPMKYWSNGRRRIRKTRS